MVDMLIIVFGGIDLIIHHGVGIMVMAMVTYGVMGIIIMATDHYGWIMVGAGIVLIMVVDTMAEVTMVVDTMEVDIMEVTTMVDH